MNLLHEVGVLLEQFQQSEWQDLYVRTARYSLFIAKAGGGVNPMLGPMLGEDAAALDDHAAEESLQSAESPAATTVRAPHLATVALLLPSGSEVQSGTVLGQLEVLGHIEEIVSDRSGRLETLVAVGTLAEYETPLLRIV